jgi:putative hydrolase of the HAD superfamily
VPVWLLDLDNTLHDALPEIMPRINRDMTAYVARALGVDHDEASRVRQAYWMRYGATLLGMIRHHAIDPHEFLRDTHRFPDMDRLVRRSAQLAHVLRRLPGRKWVVTNAPRRYAHAVLYQLGVLPLIDGMVTIESMTFAGRWQPKPSVPMFRRLLARHRFDAHRCVMVEDSVENLHGAKRTRMRTVLVSGWAWRGRAGARPVAGPGRRIDFQIQSVLTLPRIALR